MRTRQGGGFRRASGEVKENQRLRGGGGRIFGGNRRSTVWSLSERSTSRGRWGGSLLRGQRELLRDEGGTKNALR